MKQGAFWFGVLAVLGFSFVAAPLRAQDSPPPGFAVLEEKLNRLQANVEALQFSQDKTQKQINELSAQLLELRRNSGGAGTTRADLDALEAKIKAVDEARQRDNKALIDQLAKELAGAAKPVSKPATEATGNEHVVAKGDTLATVARKYGVPVADLAKANNLANPNDIKVGQKLVIPKP